MSAAVARQFPVGCTSNEGSQNFPSSKIQSVLRKAPMCDIGGERDFYNIRIGAKASPSKQCGEGVAMPSRQHGKAALQEKRLRESGASPRTSWQRKGADYHHHFHREGDYHKIDYYEQEDEYYCGEHYQQEADYYHQDTNILSRRQCRRATTFPSGHHLVAAISKSHHNGEATQPIALGNHHRQRSTAVRKCNHDPRAASLPSHQSFPPNEQHREAIASPSRQCSRGQLGDTIFLMDQSSTIDQSRTTKNQSVKVQTTHSPAGIKNDDCRPNAESINSDVFVEVDGPSSPKAEAKTAPTTIRRRASAFRTFPARCGQLQNVSKRDALLQPMRKKDTVEIGVHSSGSNRFPAAKGHNESNNRVAESHYEGMQLEAEEDAKAVSREPVPETTKEMEMDVMNHGEKASSEPESRPANEMELDEKEVGKVTKRKRKEDGFEIIQLKKGKHEFLVCDNPQAIVPINSVAPRSILERGDARKKVMETLLEYRSIYDTILQQKENILQSNQLAYKVFKEKFGGSTSAERFIGNVSGVEIGDEFRLRDEMFIIGLHRQHQAGIDYIKQHGKDIAVSIVSSGRYANNTQTEADVLLYCGSGVSLEGQKLTRRNLALKNSIDEQVPVRVIYGVNKYRGKKRTKTYVYDGLYLAEKYSFKTGNQDHSVLMFQLRRIPGQPEIAIDGLQCPRTCISSTVYMDDISNGEEGIPIRVVNAIGRDLPMPFKYITKMILPSSYSPIPPTGCNCVDGCYNSKSCSCAANNGGEFLSNFDCASIEKPLVYECGPSCRCPPTCPNRVSQHGIKIKLEIFKTESSGWGVRSPNLIPSGSFVCEYIGEILAEEEAQRRDNDEYLFGMGHNYHHDEDHSSPIPSLPEDSSRELVEDSFVVDAMKFGNVGRFINHSCSPNVFAQNVLYDHDDIRMPHIMLFACMDIQPFEELTYDYNYAIHQVHDSNGNIKNKECHCGSEECRGWLY